MFVEFVENKLAEPERILQALSPAIERNQHTNFGPVSRHLEQTLTKLNGCAADRTGCLCANATLGLQAMVSVFDNLAGRQLRWVVSDFGFFTSFIGPLRDQIHVSCAADGMICPNALSAVLGDSYDAILVTNVFGLSEDFAWIFDFCARQNKVLLIDNAAGFGALAPEHGEIGKDLHWAEAVSFHHTKPWGMGEAGAVFLSRDHENMFRAATNFGVWGDQSLTDVRLCTNGKISEIAAAQILTRVDDRDTWVPAYRRQAERILDLGQKAGVSPLIAKLPSRAVPGQIPFLCDHPVSFEMLENPFFRILKYYRPGPQSGPIARQIFDCIINVPCHAGMVNISDETISSVLKSVVENIKLGRRTDL